MANSKYQLCTLDPHDSKIQICARCHTELIQSATQLTHPEFKMHYPSNVHNEVCKDCCNTPDACTYPNHAKTQTQSPESSQNPCHSCKNDQKSPIRETHFTNASYCITHGSQFVAQTLNDTQNQLAHTQSPENMPKCPSCQNMQPIRARCYSNLTISNSNSSNHCNNGAATRNTQLSRLFLCNLCVFSSTQAKLLFSWWRNKIS